MKMLQLIFLLIYTYMYFTTAMEINELIIAARANKEREDNAVTILIRPTI